MNKVIDFFEKYAEWLAMGVAGVFLLFMIWSYVIVPTDATIEVGTEKVLPGDVEPTVQTVVRQLENKMNANSDKTIVVPNFAEQFAKAIGDDRPRGPKTPEIIAGVPFRQAVPGSTVIPGGVQQVPAAQLVQVLPKPPPAQFVAFFAGNAYVMDPANAANQAMLAQGGVNPQNAQAIAGKDIPFINVEYRVDMKALADAWKVAFPNPQVIPPTAMETIIVRCVVQREEQLSPGKWGNPVELKPLNLGQEMKDMPKAGDKVQEAIYDAWAREHQADIAEPAFYQIIEGDLKEGWRPPSVVQAEAAAKAQAGVQQVSNQPFDPATYQGPLEALTSQQKSQVYQFRQQQKREKDKQAAEERKAKAAAAEAQRNAARPSSGGGRRAGPSDYAPLPEGTMLAQAGGQRGRSLIEEEMGVRRPPVDRRQRTDDAGRPVGPGVATPGTVTPAAIDPNAVLQGGLPNPPNFNPLLVAGQAPAGQPAAVPGQPQPGNNIVCWAHDDTVVPGKIYRYRMKVLFKNPLYGTAGLAKDPAFEGKYVLDSAAPEWSDWSKDVRVPATTRYFFANAKQAMARGAVVNAVVDVFKREKGKWTKGTFTVTPGDSIGQPQGFVDFTTGDTLVDLRSEFRGDVRIITADQSGELRSSPLSHYVKDPEYLDLQHQLRAAAEAAAGTDGAAPVVPANYNAPNYNAQGQRPNAGARPGRMLREGEGGG